MGKVCELNAPIGVSPLCRGGSNVWQYELRGCQYGRLQDPSIPLGGLPDWKAERSETQRGEGRKSILTIPLQILNLKSTWSNQSIDWRGDSFNINPLHMRGSRLAEMPDRQSPANPLNLIRVIPAKGARSGRAALSRVDFL